MGVVVVVMLMVVAMVVDGGSDGDEVMVVDRGSGDCHGGVVGDGG